jgi:hypothetical protein
VEFDENPTYGSGAESRWQTIREGDRNRGRRAEVVLLEV